MWGGGDGSSDVRAGQAQHTDGAPIGAAAGAAGVAGVSEDEQIYGQQPGQADPHPPQGQAGPVNQEGLEGSPERRSGQEEVMEDPWEWETEKPEQGGWFGGEGDGDGGGWGDWGGGDWS